MIDFDLHTHTYPYSLCATQSIDELIDAAVSTGIKTLALTDHDTLGGLSRAEAGCRARGIRFINGVELSCEIKGECPNLNDAFIHLLGLNIDNDGASFARYTAEIDESNSKRIRDICAYLRGRGHQISDCADRLTLIRQLTDKKIFPDEKRARKYLFSQEIESLFPTRRLTHKQGIELIHSLNGIAVWAHPYRVYCHDTFTRYELTDAVRRMCAYGLDGLEVFHPDNLRYPDGADTLIGIANEFHLAVTLGSDRHGVTDKGVLPLMQDIYLDFDFGHIRKLLKF